MKRALALAVAVIALAGAVSLASERSDGAKAVHQAGKPFVAHGNPF